MTTALAITIPRLDGERAERYEARVRYLTMGADRSLEAAGQALAKSLPLLKRWSAEDGWNEQARAYDSTLGTLAAQAHAVAYQRDLEAHRKDAMQFGKALCGVAVKMLAQLESQTRSIEYSPAALATIARALTTGLDLRAHALDLDRLLPTLTSDREDA